MCGESNLKRLSTAIFTFWKISITPLAPQISSVKRYVHHRLAALNNTSQPLHILSMEFVNFFYSTQLEIFISIKVIFQDKYNSSYLIEQNDTSFSSSYVKFYNDRYFPIILSIPFSIHHTVVLIS